MQSLEVLLASVTVNIMFETDKESKLCGNVLEDVSISEPGQRTSYKKTIYLSVYYQRVI